MYDVRLWQSLSGKEPVKKWLDKLDSISLKKIAKLMLLLKREGENLSLPHSRPLGAGLYELRVLGTGAGYRVYYCFVEETIVVLLAGGDKDSQQRDIELARKRMDNEGG